MSDAVSRPAAAIFDLDGLLADTEPLHMRSWQETFVAFGGELESDVYEAFWIRDGKGIAEYLPHAGLDWDLASLYAEKARRYDALVRREARFMPGARDALERLRGRVRLALATSSWRASADAVVDTLGIRERFETIVARDDVARVKPHPDPFLLGAERLGVAPADCVVLEDAEKGVRAAHAAGMRCFAVPNRSTADNDFGLATRVLDSLDALTPDLLATPGDGE